MRQVAKRLRWLGVALLVLGGCHTTESQVKPKYQVEEFVQPPNDPRYSSDIVYPKDTLFTDVIKKSQQGRDGMQQTGGAGFGGGGPGMGMGPGGYR